MRLRKLLWLIVWLIALQFSSFAVAANYTYQSWPNDPAKMRVYTLANGLTVYLAQNKDEPRIQTYIAVRAGSNNDPRDNTGLAHYLEHMLFKGTSKLGTINYAQEQKLLTQIEQLYEQHKIQPSQEQRNKIYQQIDKLSYEASKYAIANEFDKSMSLIGASGVNAFTSFDQTVYQSEIPANQLVRWAQLEKERMSQLVLRLFHTELETVYEEFNRSQDNYNRQVTQTIFSNIFPTTNYGLQTTIGTAQHLKTPSMKAIHSYFKQYYVPSNMAVILVGDLDYDKTIALIDATFGKLPTHSAPAEHLAVEADFKAPRTVTVVNPEREQIYLTYRAGGSKTQDIYYLKVLQQLLSGPAGLLELNINLPQKAMDVSSSALNLKDYSLLMLSGVPKQGQSLAQVKELLLQQLNRVSREDYPDWMLTAIVKDYEKKYMTAYLDRDSVAEAAYEGFINRLSWEQQLNELEQIKKVTKQDLAQFVKQKLANNMLELLKKQGPRNDIVHVEKPSITPLYINKDVQSSFYKDLQSITVKDIQPQFVDFATAIKQQDLHTSSKLFSIYNRDNDLANITYFTDIGSRNSKKLALAFSYAQYLGTNEYTPLRLRQQLYKMGIKMSFFVGDRRTHVSVSGLKQDLPAAIEFLEKTITSYQPDQKIYDDFVTSMLTARANAKKSKDGINRHFMAYAVYGLDNELRDIFSAQELRAIKPQELTDILKDFFNYRHDVFYYGNEVEKIKTKLQAVHNFGTNRPIEPAKKYVQQDNQRQVYLFDYPQAQAEVSILTKGKIVDVKDKAVVGVLNSYFGTDMSSIVFQEIREAKALAYSAVSAYSLAAKKGEYNYLYSFIGTQIDKVPQALNSMFALLNEPLPQLPQLFESARNSYLQRIATTRYNRDQIFSYWLLLKDLGYDYDINRDVYAQLKKLKFADIQRFFDHNIRRQNYDIVIFGDKNKMDLAAVKNFGTLKELTIKDIFSY